jgi:hypothetical protein
MADLPSNSLPPNGDGTGAKSSFAISDLVR